ncbi:MAG: hypothetical protein ABI193_06180 [Minicystis sp.]
MIPGAPGPSRPPGRWGSPACLLALLAPAALGCGGGAPLFHPAHVLHQGKVSAGAGFTGQVAAFPRSAPIHGRPSSDRRVEAFTVAPGVAPWVGARLGFASDNEGGVTFTGRSLRLDGRHAFNDGVYSLSLGLGASAVSALPGAEGGWVFGGALDVPILFGYHSASDLYSLWVGPRAGVELLTGRIQVGEDAVERVALSARHLFVGGVAGLRVGFRHVHAALEFSFAYHNVNARLGVETYALDQLSLTPGGALLFSF